MPDGRQATTEDRLLGGRVLLRQPAGGYRAAIDPVLLAATIPAGEGDRVLDMGCGVGAAALCLAVRIPGCLLTGVELQPALAGLARSNATANGLEGRMAVIEGDIASAPAGLFDHAMANPPFLDRGTRAPDASKAAANMEGEVDLAGWIAAAARAVKPKGWLTMIHRADRLDAVCAALAPRFGAVAILPVWPKAGQPARRVLVRARLGARSPASLHPGLMLHRPEGGFTPEAEAILRDAAPFPV